MSVLTTGEAKGVQETAMIRVHKNNIERYKEFGGAVRNMGVNCSFSGNCRGGKP